MIQENKIRSLQMENEQMKFQISQIEEENHIHRRDLDKAAKEQTLLESAVRDLCIHLIESQASYGDDYGQDWDNMNVLELIRYSTSKIDNIVRKHTEEITQLLEMIRFYQEEMRRLS